MVWYAKSQVIENKSQDELRREPDEARDKEELHYLGLGVWCRMFMLCYGYGNLEGEEAELYSTVRTSSSSKYAFLS